MSAQEVRPGQVWADKDKRSEGRHVRVIAVGVVRARVASCDPRGTVHVKARYGSVLVAGLRSRYRLVREADGVA